MNENRINRVYSDSQFNFQYCVSNNLDGNQTFSDNDSDSSIMNLLDIESLDKTPEENISPYISMYEMSTSQEQRYHSKTLAIPDIKSDTTDKQFEELLLSKLPQIVMVKNSSFQYQIQDQNHPYLSKTFKHSFTSPVLNMLVVILNTEKLVSFYQGYFGGISRLSNELINLSGKYWKSVISNNDGNAWENHYRSVTDKFSSFESTEPEFEVGPVIRCRLRESSQHQYNQPLNYFFVQPCSYMLQLPSYHQQSGQEFNMKEMDMHDNNLYMVSYINIMRECDTEYALKGSAASCLQQVIKNARNNLEKSTMALDTSNSKSSDNCTRNGNPTLLSINISSPPFLNSEKCHFSAPLTYPMMNEPLYSKHRPQIQNNTTKNGQPLIDNQYISRETSANVIGDQNHKQYQTQYQIPHSSTSTLQYILENRNVHVSNARPLQNNPNHMLSQHSPVYQNTGRHNLPCYLPLNHSQSTLSNCSLSSPTTFMPARHLVPMPSNGVILSSNQYFRNGHQITNNDSIQLSQSPMLRSLSSTVNQNSNNYYSTTTPFQTQTSIQFINSLPYQNQYTSSTVDQYCNNNKHQYQINRTVNPVTIKQESNDISSLQTNWPNNHIKDDSLATTYCGPMTNDSISFEIVEEILKAEEAKSDCKRQSKSLSNSDNSDPLSFDIDDLGLLENGCRTQPTNSSNVSVTTNTSIPIKIENNPADTKMKKESSHLSLNLRSETLEKFTETQKTTLKNLVEQHKSGKLTKEEMLVQINEFVIQSFGKNDHYRHVIEFWKSQNSNVDSTFSDLSCSHVVQSPEEGPGISPMEQAAQSTTDIEDDKDITRQSSNLRTVKYKDDSNDLVKRRIVTKASTKSMDASIYSISSTTSTGVLETLLNEHENPVHSERNYTSTFSTRQSTSSGSRNQLSLDQLLMDDECSMLAGFTPSTQDNKHSKKTSENFMRQYSLSNTSQPTTPSLSGNMGVLESLLNQKHSSLSRIRQKSTENILKHSKPSRQNSFDNFHDDNFNMTDNNDKDSCIKKNSLLITLLNNCHGNTSTDNYDMVNSSTPNSAEVAYSASLPKRQRTKLDATSFKNESNFSSKQKNENIDIFDFVENEFNSKMTEFQSGTVTSSQLSNHQMPQQNKRNRKRCYSKEASVDSDGSSEKVSIADNTLKSSTGSKTILTSLLDSRSINESVKTDFVDNVDFDDIKIDDFDLEQLIDDESESLENSISNNNGSISASSHSVPMVSVRFSDCLSGVNYDLDNGPVYSNISSLVPSVVNISQSVPIVPISKPSIIQVSDKNSILFSAIQPTSSMSTGVIVESLDNERERLLKQQQQQKVCMSGKYVTLNPTGTADESQMTKINHTLSLDLLSKQMKEVVPNVMVQQSCNVESGRPRRASYSHIPVTMPSSSISMTPASPLIAISSSSDNHIENGKQFTVIPSQVNHQQVREGLRQLVNNRSAQNSSKINTNIQRPYEEPMCINSDFNVTRSTSSKSMIHYHSDAQLPPSQQIESMSVSYTMPNINPVDETSNEFRTTNILEDSLVNDVFELEEMVKSKTSYLETITYQNCNIPRCTSEISLPNHVNNQIVQIQSDSNSSHLHVISNGLGQQHHHHHFEHYHHNHQPTAAIPTHHHHYLHPPVSVSQSTKESTTLITNDKQNVNSNTGLLESLLSR